MKRTGTVNSTESPAKSSGGAGNGDARWIISSTAVQRGVTGAALDPVADDGAVAAHAEAQQGDPLARRERASCG